MTDSDGKIATFIVQHVLDQVALQGVDIEAVARSAGLQSQQLDNSIPWIPLSLCCDMIRAGILQTGDATMALRISQSTFPAGFGIVGHVVLACPTLMDVVNAVGRYEKLIGNIFTSTLIHEPGASIWCLEMAGCPPDVAQIMTEYALGIRAVLLKLVREKRSNILMEVRFRHAPPKRKEDLAVYERIFHCPVKFYQAHSGIVFKSEALALPLLHTDQSLRGILEVEAEKQLSERKEDLDIVARVRDRLAVLVRQGTANREALATDLGISGRHLHRELAEAGTSYSEVLDEFRLSQVKELLGTDATLEHIGKQLGFQEASSFMRWYRQRTGKSAGAMRIKRHSEKKN